ncbi:MAG: DUF58 domain-containing protein [Gammaproteobacteria bacterium]|nr:DUF58 domain-containing protein [Gammaproteobacteria bacterium]
MLKFNSADPVKENIPTRTNLTTGKQLLQAISTRFPLTTQGCLTLVLAVAALDVFAYGSLDLVVFALATCALTIVLFCLLNTVITGLLMQSRIRKSLKEITNGSKTIEIEAGYPNETGFVLPEPIFLPLIRLDWVISYPDAISTRTRRLDNNLVQETLIPHRRCLSPSIFRKFSVSDVLGFCRYTWFEKQDCRLLALPRVNTVKQLPLLRSLTAEDGIPNTSGEPEGDRMEIRPYAPGDSVKNIMWKMYARNRQLNVRLPENSVFHSKRTVAYLLSSPGDEAAAAVARVALESGALGQDWEFGADGTNEVCDELSPALLAVARSRALDAPLAYGLDRFLMQCHGQHARCIVFAAAQPSPWLGPLKQTLARYCGQFTLILATDGMEEKQQAKLWQKLLLRKSNQVTSENYDIGCLSKIQAVLTETAQIAQSILIVDRKTGASFDRFLRKV